ncbi:MAG: TRAP transporter permease [Geminicoccaceae bacterium]
MAAEAAHGDDRSHWLGWGSGTAGTVLFAVALVFSTFQIWTAAYSPLPSQVVRAVHVGFLLLLCFGLFGNHAGPSRPGFWLYWALGILSFAAGLYHWVEHDALILRAGDPSTADLVVGVIAIALVFVGAWRIMGLALPTIAGLFLAYGLFGQHLPSPFNHRGYDFSQVVDQMFLGTEGIYGVPTYVSSTYIFLFILFGAFLERAGMIRLFNDLALGTVGHTRGGPAKVAVIASAMMGTINGSGVANVVTTGQFTIPLMKRFGFRPAFAGAVEATASMGGQIMPPVMGAVAFIMAETLGLPYVDIVQAAIVPALLYFFTVFLMVHLEAGRLGLSGLPAEECPNAAAAIRNGWYLLLPLAALVYVLFSGYTPLFAGTVGLALTAVLILGSSLAPALHAQAARIVFWVVLGIASSAFFRFGITAVLGLVLILVVLNALRAGGRETLLLCRDSLAEGARNALPVGIACALVGVIIGTLTLTGAASNFAQYIVSVGSTSLFLSLLLTMLTCLVLGMGIPTIPNYIITSSIAGPALLELGVPLLVSHMFVFYFGIMADLTPPVALAAFAASPIARAPGLLIGLHCMRIAVAGFVVPFIAVYTPALMLQDGGPVAQAMGYPLAIAYVVLKAAISVALWGVAAIGFALRPIGWPDRVAAAVAATLLVVALPVTDELGLALAALLAWRWWRGREPVPHRA